MDKGIQGQGGIRVTKYKGHEWALGQIVARSNVHNSEGRKARGNNDKRAQGQRGAPIKGYKDNRVQRKITHLLMDSKNFVTFVQLTSNT